MINNVYLMGKVFPRYGEKTLTLKRTKNGKDALPFQISVPTGSKNDKGEWQYSFIDCMLWGERTKILIDNLKDNGRIIVQGKLIKNSFEKDGKKLYSTEVLVDTFDIIDFKDKTTTTNNFTPSTNDIPDDDLPF